MSPMHSFDNGSFQKTIIDFLKLHGLTKLIDVGAIVGRILHPSLNSSCGRLKFFGDLVPKDRVFIIRAKFKACLDFHAFS